MDEVLALFVSVSLTALSPHEMTDEDMMRAIIRETNLIFFIEQHPLCFIFFEIAIDIITQIV